jgi:hypothetical protein
LADRVPHPILIGLTQALVKRRYKLDSVSRKLEFAEKVGITAANLGLAAAHHKDLLAAVRGGGHLSAQQRGQVPVQQLDNAIQPYVQALDADPRAVDEAQWKRLTKTAAGEELPELVTFIGFLGATFDVRHREPKTWRVLFTDAPLQNWYLIPEERIVYHYRMPDDGSPFRRRDVIWVDRDAITTRGGAPPRPEAQADFLLGEFTRAGDLPGPGGTGGGPGPATGVFCDAITPECCTRH